MMITGSHVPVKDLTRWNRSGLDRVRYIDGAAAEWLEYLRVCHLLLFSRLDDEDATELEDPDVWLEAFRSGKMPDGTSVHDEVARLGSQWQRFAPDGNFPPNATYAEILRAQYDFIALDQTRQISRAFARALHILTESLNAYANEGYLATATQDEHLRRLMEMIGYQPVPAASAMVDIAILLAEEELQQTIAPGLAFEHNPGNGEPLITFESLGGVVADLAANLIRPLNWDKRSDPLEEEQIKLLVSNAAVFSNELVGTYGLIADGVQAEGVLINEASKADNVLLVERGKLAAETTYQTAEVKLVPGFSLEARPQGSTWLHFAAVPNCWVGQTVALQLGSGGFVSRYSASGTIAAEAVEFVEPVVTEWFAASVAGVEVDIDAKVLEVRGRDVRIDVTVPQNVVGVYPTIQGAVERDPSQWLADASNALVLGNYVVPEGSAPVGTLEPFGEPHAYFDGEMPENINDGDVVTVVSTGGIFAGAVMDIQKRENGFSCLLEVADVAMGDVLSIHGGFKTSTGLQHEVRSPAALFDAQGRLDLTDHPILRDLIKPGRRLIVATDPDLPATIARKALAVTVDTVAAPASSKLWLSVLEDLSALAGLSRGNAVIYGNVAQFGQGKTLPQKVLGSGDNSLSGQAMVVTDVPLSTRSDPAFPGGIVQDVEITVDRRKWRLVADAEQADRDQPSYSISTDHDGSTVVNFHHRLPTATDNVVMTRLRKGAGKTGNDIAAFSIKAPQPAAPNIAALVQPLVPQGGADLQGADALRKQGDSHFALVDRALSAQDFATLAESHTAVWHASATLRRLAGGGGRATIVLTVVPNGGGSVTSVQDELTDYLLSRALPDTSLKVEPFNQARFGGTGVLNLKSGYARNQSVIDDVKTVFEQRFGLQNRPLGKTLFVTELIAAAEEHEAVENVTFTLQPLWTSTKPRLIRSATDAIQAVTVNDTFSIYLESADAVSLSFGPGGA